MPRYSPSRTLFSSVNKKLWDIPWAEAHNLFRDVQADLIAEAQEKIDIAYEEEIRELEQKWTDSHEAPYEGNFTDSTPKPSVSITQGDLEKAIAERIRTEFIEKYKLILHMDWMMPQIITYLGNLPKTLNDEGKVCGFEFRKNFKTDAEKGLYRFLMINERSSYLKLQYKAPAKQYCALVPLILYAQRLVDQTPYTAWSKDTLKLVVNSDLCDAMLCEVPEITKNELLAIRTSGLTTATGTLKNPLTTHMLYGKEQAASIIGDLPKLAKVMLTQIWCAHPSNRTRYMVLSPNNWDRMPNELVTTEVVIEDHKSPSKAKLVDLNDDF